MRMKADISHPPVGRGKGDSWSILDCNTKKNKEESQLELVWMTGFGILRLFCR